MTELGEGWGRGGGVSEGFTISGVSSVREVNFSGGCWDPGGHYGLVYICEPGFRVRIKKVKTRMY